MTRWLICHPGPSASVGDVYEGWAEALRGLGQDVTEYNTGDRLVFYDSAYIPGEHDQYRKAFTDDDDVIELALNGLAAALWKARPHILLLVSAFFWDAELLEHARRAYGTTVVILHTESPYEDDRQLMTAPYADLHLVNDPVSVPKFAKVCRAVYCPHGYRPSVHFPASPGTPFRYDLAFAGSGFASRVRFLEEMGLDGLDVVLAGNWTGLPEGSPLNAHLLDGRASAITGNAEVAEMYRTMRAGINLYRREANFEDLIEGHGIGPREVEMAACGAFFLRDPRPESDAVFGMLPSFGSAEEAGELLRWYLPKDDLRRELAAKARAAAADRTFTNHAAQVMRLLGIDS